MTLLSYNSKYVIPSVVSSTTTSSSLVDDPQASQTFSLDATRVVLVIYEATCDYGATAPDKGGSHAISVDTVDYAQSWDSSFTNGPHRDCVFWIGSLGAGSHTIKGRFASNTNGSTFTISRRVLLIYVLNGDEFQYVDDATQRTVASTTLTDDASASVTFTPSAQCKLLALYNAANNPSANEDGYGKKVAISIAGADYGQAEKAANYTGYADSVFTCHALQRAAVSTTVKGRFANAHQAATVYINRRQLGVLLFSDDTLLDIVTSTTQVNATSVTLVDDTEATISRSISATQELLVIAMGTKRDGTADTNYYGHKYGIKVNDNDRVEASNGNGANTRGMSAATAYAETLDAGSHTIKGRFCITGGGAFKVYVDARQVVALWLGGPTYVNVSDVGAGVDEPSIQASMLVTESGAGAEVPSVAAAVPVSEWGAGNEATVIGGAADAHESAAGSDQVASIGILASDAGAGSESPALQATIPSAELGVGSETPTVATSVTVADDGVGTEYATMTWTILFEDMGFGVEFAWRIKGSILIDSVTLPHVMSIQITDEAQMSDKKIEGGALPKRKIVGKPGRVVEIQGWSDDQSELDTMDALADGTRRTFIHPSGDSFAVLITAFDYDRTADQYTRRDYRLTLKETR